MLNTNADTIASSVAQTLASVYDVTLTYCSSTPGVLGPERPVERNPYNNQFRFRPDGRRRHHLRGNDPETPERL